MSPSPSCNNFSSFAVLDKGCGSITIVFILTCCGWVLGVIAALIILNKNEPVRTNYY